MRNPVWLNVANVKLSEGLKSDKNKTTERLILFILENDDFKWKPTILWTKIIYSELAESDEGGGRRLGGGG